MASQNSINRLLKRWFPASPDRANTEQRLREFYRESEAYHGMTAAGKKAEHPQARLLQCLLNSGGVYAEIGCGGGGICAMVSRIARVYGFDFSEMALRGAIERCADADLTAILARGESIPFRDNTVDGCYSFEVLEHVWDPVAVLKEMARITKPGGFILISTPNWFSLDLHLRKRDLAKLADCACAGMRFVLDGILRRTHVNLVPSIDGQVYPDCDMVASLIPWTLGHVVRSVGCEVDFLDTTYMCAHREESKTTLDFQKNNGKPFFRYFGDHILLLAHKRHG